MNDCLKSSLRMRPDRIIVGEVRGSECATLLTAMNTGHDGSFGSLREHCVRDHHTDDQSPDVGPSDHAHRSGSHHRPSPPARPREDGSQDHRSRRGRWDGG